MYDFSNLKLNDHIETCSNPKGDYCMGIKDFYFSKIGLCSINNEPENNIILAYPGKVSLCFYKENSSKESTNKENISKENTITINAHNSVLSCIELDNRGLKLATSSEKVYLSQQNYSFSFREQL